jgi:hypothetical protein
MIFRKKVPGPVTAADVEAAKRLLQPHTNFNIDEFLEEMTTEVLFSAPLGSTTECLNIDDIANAADETLNDASRMHLDQCVECAQHVRRYEALKKANQNWGAAAGEVEIFNTIRVPPGKNLYVVLFNRGEMPVLSKLEPGLVQVSGAIQGKVKSVSMIDPKRYEAKEAVELHFHDAFQLNVPETGAGEEVLVVDAVTEMGRFCKKQRVYVIDEEKVQNAASTGVAI